MGEKYVNLFVRYILEYIIVFWEILGKFRSNEKYICDKELVFSKYKFFFVIFYGMGYF